MNEAEERRIGPEELRAEVLQSVAEDELRAPRSRPSVAVVNMNISPEAIPFESAHKEHLVEVIASQFGSRYKRPPIPLETAAAIPIEALMQTTRDNGQMITFAGGRLELPGSDRVTPIQQLAFGEQNLLAAVNGVTAEAEYLCKQLCLLLWESTNKPRRWDELEELVEITTYKTSTIVDLGVSLLELLSEDVRTFLNEDVGGDRGLGKHMGFGSSLDPDDIMLIPHCREVELILSVFDKVSGRSEDCVLDLMAHTRTEENRSIVKIASDLDTTKHNDMVAALVRKLGG